MNAITSAANVEIVKFAAFYKEGYRGLVLGQAPQNDKVWGIAKVNGKIVTFWGRRNGELRTKLMASSFEAHDKFNEKIGGRRSGDVYSHIANEGMIKLLSPNLKGDVARAVNKKFN